MLGKGKKEKRFNVIFDEGNTQIILDKETGVNYLCIIDGTMGGKSITPLLGSDGKPIITIKDNN